MTKPRESAAKGATVALILLTAMNFVNYLDRYILPAVQEQVKHEFRISDDQLGSLTTWFFFAYVLSSPLTAWLGEKFPRKTVIVIAALAISAMNFFTASVHNYMSLNIRHAALGVGEACFGIFAPTLLADFFAEDQRNKVLTIFNVAIPVGAAMGYLVGGMIGHSQGWRVAFIASAIPGAVIALLILFFMREPARPPVEKPVRTGGLLEYLIAQLKLLRDGLLKNPAYMSSILGYAAVTFSMGGISWWMVSFLQRMNGYSQDKAGTVMGGITVVCGLGGTICGGVLAQWWSKKTDKALYLVPALSAVLAVPPAMLCFFGPKTMTLPALGVAMFVIFLGTGPVNASTLNAVPANLRAAAMAGQLFTIHILGDAFSPKIIGIISDHSNLRLGLGSTLVTFLLAGVIFFIGAKYAPKLHHTLEGSAA
jgi:MFS family permease